MENLNEQMRRIMGNLPESPVEQRPGNSPDATNGRTSERAPIDALFDKVPEKYRGCLPEDVPQLRGFVPDGINGVCFRGNPGIGKTYAATALARMFVGSMAPSRNPATGERYYEPGVLQWVSTPYLLARIRATFGRARGAEGGELSIIDAMIRARILVLDDLGAEKSTEFTGMTLYTILSGRDNDNRMTIVTTNQTLAEIHAWEPRIASRIGGMMEIKLPNKDRRERA